MLSRYRKLAKNRQDIYLRSISFDKKTKDPYHYVHSHGTCFESELIAMRVYFDHRQTIDLYGKNTHNNFYRLYDAAMLSVTSYTKVGLRLATIFGSICAAISMIVAIVYLVMKLLHWYDFPAGMAPVLIGMCFLGSVQIFFIGLVGEYILSINSRVMKRPLVVEEERLNFDTPVKKVGGKQHEM